MHGLVAVGRFVFGLLLEHLLVLVFISNRKGTAVMVQLSNTNSYTIQGSDYFHKPLHCFAKFEDKKLVVT